MKFLHVLYVAKFYVSSYLPIQKRFNKQIALSIFFLNKHFSSTYWEIKVVQENCDLALAILQYWKKAATKLGYLVVAEKKTQLS